MHANCNQLFSSLQDTSLSLSGRNATSYSNKTALITLFVVVVVVFFNTKNVRKKAANKDIRTVLTLQNQKFEF